MNEIEGYESLVDEIKDLIHRKQYVVFKFINTETINLYWEIGEEIYKQQEEKGWGKSIVQVLSKELQKEFPGAKRYSAANLWRMRNFYLTYSESEKLAPLVREISWSNNIVIMEKCKDKTFVEYALRQSNAPIGVATYQLSTSLPDNMKEMLPEPAEIVRKLGIFEDDKRKK